MEVRVTRRPRTRRGLSEQEATIGGPVEFDGVMDVRFITSVAVITPDPKVSRGLYVDALGLPLTAEGDGTCIAKTSTVASPSGSGR
jgi:hypothetical protein